MSRQHRPIAARISRHVAAGLAGFALAAPAAAPAAARADDAGPAVAVLLIGNSDYAALPKLPGCVPAMRSLADRLRAKGGDVSEQFDAAGPSLQAAIGSFAVHLLAGRKAAIVYCGYVAADADKLFLLPVGATTAQPADLPRQAIIARTLSRVLSGHDSILVAEMHPTPGASSLSNAVQGLREASAMSTYLDLRTVDGTATPEIDDFARTVDRSAGWPYQAASGSGQPQAVATAGGGPAAPSTPPSPAASTEPSSVPAPLEAAGPATSAPADAVPARPEPVAGQPGPGKAGPEKPAPETRAPEKPAPGTPAPARPAADRTVPGRPATVASAGASGDGPVSATEKSGPVAPDADKAAAPKPVTPKPPRVAAGTPGGSPSIRRLQVSLLALGYYNHQIDGLASPATQAAVRAYQRSLKHPETGFLTYAEGTELGKVGARR